MLRSSIGCWPTCRAPARAVDIAEESVTKYVRLRVKNTPATTSTAGPYSQRWIAPTTMKEPPHPGSLPILRLIQHKPAGRR